MAGFFQPTTAEGVAAAAEKHGPAPGAKTLLEAEKEAAEHAMATGLYTVMRSYSDKHPDFCTRVAPTARCFCGHPLADHSELKLRACGSCKCKAFRYIPFRPEEVGEFWLVRRKGFNVHTWRAKCRCKCGSDCHDPTPPYRCRSCSCSAFQSDFLCVVCDLHWEEHETVTESEEERRAQGLPVGADFVPFNAAPQLFDAVFRPRLPGAVRPKQSSKPEKSVRLMPVNCGGRGEGKPARPALADANLKATSARALAGGGALGGTGTGAGPSASWRGESPSRGQAGGIGIGRGGGRGQGMMARLASPAVDPIERGGAERRRGGRSGSRGLPSGGVGAGGGGGLEGGWAGAARGCGVEGGGMGWGGEERGAADLQGIYAGRFGGEREAAQHNSGDEMLRRLQLASRSRR